MCTAFGISLLDQSICLDALTQPWPLFHREVGPLSYWLRVSLNIAALVSVIVILSETKGISLERMGKIFGQVDAAAAGEQQTAKEIAAEGDAAHGASIQEDDLEKVRRRFRQLRRKHLEFGDLILPSSNHCQSVLFDSHLMCHSQLVSTFNVSMIVLNSSEAVWQGREEHRNIL